MAFPTTSVLDTFTRADGTVGANYTDDTGGTTDIMNIVSNQATSSPGNYKSALWTSPFAADQEVFVTWTTVAGAFDGGPQVYLRWNTASRNGYIFNVNNNTTPFVCSISSVAGGTPTQLGATFNQTFADGDKIGASVIGNTISAYIFTGGAWSLLTTRTDSTYTGSGKIGFYSDYFGRTFDDFGGGAYVSPELPYPTPRIRRRTSW